jgi:S-methylmethionine-dependent homocysteine/selenocysteine methylase
MRDQWSYIIEGVVMKGVLVELLNRRTPLILDGAMGTEIQRRGVDTGLPMWSANALFSKPALIQQIHTEYIEAGADIITSNTFRTTRRTMRRANLPDRSKQLTETAVHLAMRAREQFPDREILVAGSIAPLEDCYRPDLVPSDAELHYEHMELAERLATAGVDFLLVETMNTIREAYAACAAGISTGKEVIVSFVCNSNGDLLSGETLADAVKSLADLRPAGFSINCVSPHHMAKAVSAIATHLPRLLPGAIIAAYGNIGNPESDVHGWEFTHDMSEEQYAGHAADWTRTGVSIVGGCCGTTPAYIESTTKALRHEGEDAGRRKETMKAVKE